MGLPQTTPSDPEKDPLHRRIVLLGRTGAGKSATGNTILGEKRFRSELSSSSVTSQSEIQCGEVSGRNVSVIDTPTIFDTALSPEKLGMEIGRSIYLSSPGPHAFLYVQPVNIRFTEQEENVIQKLELIFGREMRKYTTVLFTHGDQLEEKSVEELIQENRSLRRLVNACGGRYHIFNNKHLRNREQVSELLQKIDRMVEENGGTWYSTEMYEEAARIRKEEEERKREEREKEEAVEERRKGEETEEPKQEEKFCRRNLRFVLIAGFVGVLGGRVIGAILTGKFEGKVGVEGVAIGAGVGLGLAAIWTCIRFGLWRNAEKNKKRRQSSEGKSTTESDGTCASPDLNGTSDSSHLISKSNIKQRSKAGESQNQD